MSTPILELHPQRARKRAQLAIERLESEGLAVMILSDEGNRFDVVVYDPDEYEPDAEWIKTDNSMRVMIDGDILLQGDAGELQCQKSQQGEP